MTTTFLKQQLEMTPREIRMDFKTKPTQGLDKSELIEKRIKEMIQLVSGWNANFQYEEIPFKLKLVLYEQSVDFEHLTEEDLERVKKAPKRVNTRTEEWYNKLNY